MRCRPWMWLWGLLPLALIVFLTTIGERQRVERDLTVRTEQILQAEGLGWAKLQFEGRDGVLGGTAPSKADRVLAFDIAQRVHGVRVIRNEAVTETAVRPYTWQVTRDGSRIVLSGHMPDNDSIDAALRAAETRYPDATVVNEMTVARGAPKGGLWTSGTSFALRQLGHVRTGVVTLTDTTFEMVGRVTSPIAYKQLFDALNTGLPKGWTLGKSDIAIPTVETYSWSFDRLGGDIVLNGYVPNETMRARLIAAARKRYPSATVTDRMIVAGGAPDGFETFALAAMSDTASLDEVRVSLQDRDVTLTGLAADQRVADAIAEQLSGRVSGIGVANKLRAKRTGPPRADPFVWSARQSGDVVTLSGHVPDAQTRAALLQRARAVNPDMKIRDEMTLASGVPEGRDAWLRQAGRGLAAMAAFENGFAELSGSRMRVGGETQDDAAFDRGNGVLNGQPIEGFTIVRLFDLLEPEVDLEEEARWAREAEAAERKRVAALAATEEAERKRKADEEALRLRQVAEDEAIEADRLRKIAEAEAAEERQRVAALEAEERAEAERKQREADEAAEQERIARVQEAERQRELAEGQAAEKRAADDERERLASLQRAADEKAAQEAERARFAALRKKRQDRRKQYRLVAEFNGTPVDLWLARRKARADGKDETSVDASVFSKRAEDSQGRLVLAGKVASSRMRVALRRVARSQFDGGVVDRLEVIDGADDAEWQAAATQGLMELSRLRNGAVVVEQGSVELYGDAVSQDAARAVRASMDKNAPVRFGVTSLIAAPKALEKKVVEKKIEETGPVNAGECGNLMNSVANLAPIRFASESADIRRKAYGTLDKVARIAKKCPETQLRIAGHTDSRGPEGYNQKLSEQRAESVLRYLADKGVARGRMRARGLGESQPLVGNTGEANREKNRRIEFTVTGN